MQDFLILECQNDMIPTLNKPTRVIRKTATTLDHILWNTFVGRTSKSGILKNVSDHFPVIFPIPSAKFLNEDEISYIMQKICYW